MRTRIPKIIAEINCMIGDYRDSEDPIDREAVHLLKAARKTLADAQLKLINAENARLNKDGGQP